MLVNVRFTSNTSSTGPASNSQQGHFCYTFFSLLLVILLRLHFLLLVLITLSVAARQVEPAQGRAEARGRVAGLTGASRRGAWWGRKLTAQGRRPTGRVADRRMLAQCIDCIVYKRDLLTQFTSQ